MGGINHSEWVVYDCFNHTPYIAYGSKYLLKGSVLGYHLLYFFFKTIGLGETCWHHYSSCSS